MKKFSYKDDFESIYLRCDYLNRINKYDVEAIKEYDSIIKNTSYQIWNIYNKYFEKVNFQIEDIISIAKIYTFAYIELYSFKNNKKSLDRFRNKFFKNEGYYPNEKLIKRQERNNLINFLRIKLRYCSVLCERKAKSIKVSHKDKLILAETKDSIAVNNDYLIENYHEFGYRKVSKEEYKQIKKESKNKKNLVDKDNYKIFIIRITKDMTNEDYETIRTETCDNIPNPEELVIAKENEALLEQKKQKFNKLTKQQKHNILKNFIKQNKDKKYLKQSLMEAKRILRFKKDINF